MNDALPILMLLVGVVLGAAGVWIVLRAKIEHAAERARGAIEAERATLIERLEGREQTIVQIKTAAERANELYAEAQQKLASLVQEKVLLATTLQKEREQTAEKLALLGDAEQKLTNAFKALAAEALSSNNQSFLNLANTTLEKFQASAKDDLEKRHLAIGAIVEPVKLSLDKVDAKIQALEANRAGAYAGLTQQIHALIENEKQLRAETAGLVKALRAPNVRGRWGEIQLKRVVELAGMLEHCDFHEQVSETTEEGRLRPDMVVHLPGGVNIVVDAKAPLAAYLEALEATDDQMRLQKMKEHARQVQSHVASLSKKSYWEQFQSPVDFVILFLPGESFYDAAREQDPTLIEAAVEQRVMIATPMSLITLLRAIALGWRQERLARNAEEISTLGKVLYDRLSTLGDHLIKLGRSLDGAVRAYNESVGTLETRVLASARKFRDLGAASGDKEIPDMLQLDHTTRKLQRVELLPPSESAAAILAIEDGVATVKQAKLIDAADE
ncbi:MAG TPA: DNA recombination protein RmuC [Pirellulales bacterium]|jgi:DNA recombination protein RmuC|nr:DNA recombination protein RmuC [Pirellulales bacterium]